MPWNNKVGYPLTEQNVVSRVPPTSGVYGIYRDNNWVYFGESDNLSRRLHEHLSDASHAMHRYAPLHFSFEVLPLGRVARQDQLICEFNPACNQKLG